MEYKLIVENFRRFIKEQEEEQEKSKEAADYPADQKATVRDLLGKEYEQFVRDLEQKIKDPKFSKFLKMGIKKYDGDSQDDQIKVSKEEIPVSELMPTQSQIGLADSLGWTSANNPQGAAKTAKLNDGTADVGGRIITADGKYIVDGHHRWSQVFLLNPNAKIPAWNFNSADGTGKGALKLAHLAIAAVDNGVPLQPADAATDVYATNGDLAKIKDMLDDERVIGDAMAKELGKAWAKDEGKPLERDEVINIIADNAVTLFNDTRSAAADGPERGLMPQTGGTDDFGETDPVAKMKAMAAGAVNWNPKA